MQIIELNGLFVNNFILYDDSTTAIIDTGFLNGIKFIEKALNNIGRSIKDIDYILLTHGHLDHTLHVYKLKELSQAKVVCTQAEQIHVNGKYPYTGWTRVTQFLEAFGRLYFRYRPVDLDIHVEFDQVLDLFGGLQIISLPGHSVGHIGYLHKKSKVLFVGDFIDTRRKKERFPPFIFNSFPHKFDESIQRVNEMDLNGIISNHGPRLSAEEQLKRFKIFSRKYFSKRNDG